MDFLDSTFDSMQVIGGFALFSFIAYLTVRLIQSIVKGRKAQLRFGAEALVLLTLSYILLPSGLELTRLHDFTGDIQNFVAFLWWLNLAFSIDNSLHLYAWDGFLSERGKRHTPRLVTAGISLLLYTLAIVIVLHFFYDKSVAALLATSGTAAVILGFSAQSTLKEVFAGLSLNLTKAVRMGDFVEIDSVYGEIYEINWRSISVKNPHTGSLYIFPNSMVAEKTILNFSEPDGHFKYFVTFVVDPASSPEKAIRKIAEELEFSRYTYRNPKPDFNILGFNEFGVEIRIRFYFHGDDPWWDAQNEVCMAIWGAMRRHGLRLGINRFHLGHEKVEWLSATEDLEQTYSTDHIEKQLSTHPAFVFLDNEAISRVANSVEVVDFNPPSCFYKPGDKSDAFYLVLEGTVAIYRTHDEHEVCIEECNEGEVFGLTGVTQKSDRVHLAQAKTYAVVARIEIGALASIAANETEILSCLREQAEIKSHERDKQFHHELVQTRQASLQNDKRHLVSEIHKSLDHALHRSWLSHLGDHLFSKAPHADYIDTIMAACALISSAREYEEGIEDQYLISLYKEYNLIKYLDVDHAMERFHFHYNQITANKDQGRSSALEAIGEFAKHHHKAHIILGVVQHLNLHSDKENEIVHIIAEALQLENDIPDITDAMKTMRT